MATPMMPDAPEPQNRMMSAGAGAMPMQPPAGPNMMQSGPLGGAPGGPPQAPQPPPDPKKIRDAVEHNDIVIKGLIKLVTTPPGSLTKKEVFDGASDMIAEGGFPTPAQKQALIIKLAEMPGDDKDIRASLSGMLTSLLDMRAMAFRAMQGGGQA